MDQGFRLLALGESGKPVLDTVEHYAAYGLVSVRKGRGHVDYQGESRSLSKGDLLVARGLGRDFFRALASCEYQVLFFTHQGLPSEDCHELKIPGTARSLELPCILNPSSVQEQQALQLLAILEDSHGSQTPEGESLVHHTLMVLLLQLLCWQNQSPRTLESEQVAKAVSFLRENLEQKISLRDMAAVACLSERHLSRLFVESKGMSPHQFLLGLRMDRARELLGETSLPVLEVATRCGFEDSNHFSRQFHHVIGLSPSDYRGGKQK